MNRTRTALLALLATLTVPGLAACSGSGNAGTVHTGSAAVVGTQRISIATVEDQVSAFRQAAPPQGQSAGAQASYGQDSAGEPSRVLDFLIQTQVVQTALDQKGLTVTATDVSKAEAGDLAKFGSATRLTAAFVSQLGLPPQDVEAYYRQSAGVQVLLRNAGVSPSDPNAAGALNSVLQPIAAHGISVNPRYGTWDPATGSLGNASQPWIKQVSQAGAS